MVPSCLRSTGSPGPGSPQSCMSYCIFTIKIYLKRERELFHPLVLSPAGYKRQAQARYKPRVRYSILVSDVSVRGLSPWAVVSRIGLEPAC